MAFAFTRWGLTPAAFWATTPRELAAALGRDHATAGFDRAALDRLMRRYPDRTTPHVPEDADGHDR